MANNNHFELTLDTLAPQGSITRPDHYLNANDDLVIVKGDAVYMKVWFNQTAIGTTSDEGYTQGSWIAADTTYETEFTNDGTYYYHLVLMDDVANESEVYNTSEIVFDTTLPTVSGVYMEDPDSESRVIVNNLTGIIYGFAFADSLSGVSNAQITGDDIDTINLNETQLGTSPFEGTLNFKAGTADGTKTISVVVTDKAGNASVAATGSIVLDTALTKPILVLKKDASTVLAANAWINYHSVIAQLTDADTDIVGYKIWEDGTSEPSSWTSQSAGALNVSVNLTLSANDGSKTVHAKVIDSAGNISTADDVSVRIDTVLPVVSISTDKSIISEVSGFTTAVLTLSGTDASSGVASYDLKCGSTTISSGTSVPASFNLTSANSMSEGSNTITLTVVDNAGNSNSANVAVILDTTSPTASITSLNTWYNDEFDIQANYSDANGVETLYAWTSTTAEDTTVPAGASAIEATTSPQTISELSIDWHLSQSASNYMHIKVIDVVGNVSYAHAQFGYDNVVPSCDVAFTADAYASTTASVNITYSDATSGVAYMKVWGDITAAATEQTAEWEEIASSKSVTLTSTDGMKTIYLKVKDNAGNISSSASDSAELDTSVPTGVLSIYEANGTTAKPSISPLATLAAHVGCTDDSLGAIQFKLYGDFTYESQSAQGITEQAAEWQTLTLDSGKTYQTVLDMYCTSGDGVKTIYLKVKDNAGNVSTAVSQQFTYDTSAPEVEVSDIDYNRLSKVHVLRRNNSGEISGKYADQTNFVFTPNEAIQAYKVVAYEDQTAAEAGSHSDDPIPSTAGSVNMSATGLNSNAAVSAMIKGLDFENALGGASVAHEKDGAHIVVVYVQDLGGTWSVAAEFEA